MEKQEPKRRNTMNMRKEHNPSDVAQDLYDCIGLNGVKARDFFSRYVEKDRAFMVSEDSDGNPCILMDEFDIIIKPK